MRRAGTLSLRERGQSVVEVALILPIFLMCVLGMIDLGRAVYAELVLTGAVREGCRAAIVQSNTNAVVVQTVIDAAVGLSLPSGNVTISGARTMGSTVTVLAVYTFVPVTPGMKQLAGNSIQLGARSAMVVD
jgi:hypothetical protein